MKVISTHNGTYHGQVDYTDQPHGEGLIEYNDGRQYNGQWQHGLRHGKGTLKISNPKHHNRNSSIQIEADSVTFYSKEHFNNACWSEVYIGEWHKDLQHGPGQHLYKNGDYYKGSFAFGQRSGYGTLKEAKKIYSGFWENNIKHGEFMVFCEQTGEAFEMQFENDKHIDLLRINPALGIRNPGDTEYNKLLPFLDFSESSNVLNERHRKILKILYQLERALEVKAILDAEKSNLDPSTNSHLDKKYNQKKRSSSSKVILLKIFNIINIE